MGAECFGALNFVWKVFLQGLCIEMLLFQDLGVGSPDGTGKAAKASVCNYDWCWQARKEGSVAFIGKDLFHAVLVLAMCTA